MERKLDAVDLVADLAGGLTWAAAFATPGVGHVLAVTAGVLGLAKVARGGFKAFQTDRSTTLDAIRAAAYAQAESMVATLGERFDLKDADAALAASLEHCVLDTDQLLAAAQTKEGYAKRGKELVIAALAERRPDLFSAARSNDNALAYAHAVVLAALESAMSGDNFTALQPQFELETQRKLALLVELNGDEVAWQQRVEGKIDSGFADLKNDTARILELLQATGLSKTQVRNLLDAFEHGAMPIEKAEELLLKAAAELHGLRERLSRLSNEDSAEIQARLAAARKAIDDGDFKHADELLAEAETADLHAGEQRIRRAASTIAERASLARAQAKLEIAAEHYGRAAETIAAFDKKSARDWWFSQADVLDDHGKLFPGPSLHRAVAILRDKCLPLTPRELHAADWAKTKNNLGVALRNLGERASGEVGIAALNDAIAAYRSALEVYTRRDLPADWALTQNNLGAALQNLGVRAIGEAGIRALNDAVAAFRAALEVYTREDMPGGWATTQNNLGVALQAIGERASGEVGIAALNDAVAAYSAVLEVYTREDRPVDWAMIQNNLGGALQALGASAGDEGGIATLNEAVAAYRAALEVRVRKSMPALWALTQNNLGTALLVLGERTGGEEGLSALGNAVIALEASLEVRTKEHMPYFWGRTSKNLALTLAAIERLKASP